MRHGYTHITLVCDRSGSMSTVQSDAEGAVNHFIDEQKTAPGEATLTLIQFDASLDSILSKAQFGEKASWYDVVYDGEIRLAPAYHLKPRGNTALNDAIGTAITQTGEKLEALAEDERPEHVVFVVQTDGLENSSRDWNLEKVRDAIKHQTDNYNWQFVFLGMGPDAFGQGHQMGFQAVTRSAQAPMAYAAAYSNTSAAVTGLRGGKTVNLDAANVEVDEHGNVTADS